MLMRLLDTTAGMSNSEILNYQLDVFRKTLEECKNKKGQKIVFIHGKGMVCYAKLSCRS